jgi:chemotaxis response regulator CheB
MNFEPIPDKIKILVVDDSAFMRSAIGQPSQPANSSQLALPSQLPLDADLQ